MRINKAELEQIIAEEIKAVLKERAGDGAFPTGLMDPLTVGAEKVVRAPIRLIDKLFSTDPDFKDTGKLTKLAKKGSPELFGAVAVVWPSYKPDIGRAVRNIPLVGKSLSKAIGRKPLPLGHAGIAWILPTGLYYYEFGRYYKKSAKGKVRYRRVPLKKGQYAQLQTGEPEVLQYVLKRLRRLCGKKKGCPPIVGAFLKDVDIKAGIGWCKKMRGSGPHPYSVATRMAGLNCATFVVKALEVAGATSVSASAQSALLAVPARLIPALGNDYDEPVFTA